MKAVTVVPGTPGSTRFDDVPEPDPELGSVVVESLVVGVCGTDAEIAGGTYGWAPSGEERLILGHESLGRVVEPGPTGLAIGELAVGIVRRPDPRPCPNCAVGEWDMCSNGEYTERGIKRVHGFMAERWRIEPEYVVRVDASLGLAGVLLEPTSVVAKAWEQILTIGQRTFWEPRTVLVVGAGPIGLLAALIGVQRGFDVHVLDRVTSGPKPALVEKLGATYQTGTVAETALRPDIVVECTGVASLVQQAADATSPGGIVCLTGVGSPSASKKESSLATDAVLKNLVMFGSVNANRRHYYRAARVLATADRSWLDQLITRRVSPDDVDQALTRRPDDIKVVLQFGQL
ncbi:MAG: glucose 1-dehydrogenase [Acidimicrobiales bacterium]|jgi:threonine dehydrogenase-like Zn-dependent dehydrogenase